MVASFLTCVRRVTLALFVLQLALLPMMAFASDADSEQDFCVGDSNNPTIVNCLVCKNPVEVKPIDFKFSGLATPRNTNNPLGSNVTVAFATKFPGINTLGISMARIDFAKGGLVPPHTHLRAMEIIFVVEGFLFVGFREHRWNTLCNHIAEGWRVCVPQRSFTLRAQCVRWYYNRNCSTEQPEPKYAKTGGSIIQLQD